VRSQVLVLGGVLALLAACRPPIPQPDPEDVQAARKAAIAFEIKMKREIVDRVERDEDPVAVYLAYADHVPGWARDISGEMKFDFGRTSLAVRNEASTPDAWEQRQMEGFNYLMDAGAQLGELETAEIVQEGDRKVFRWMRPIVMEEAC